MRDVTGRLQELGDAALWVSEWGDCDAPPVLCWHMLGPGQSGERLAGLARRLADDHGLRPLVLDGPGFGRSPSLPPDRYRPSALADLAAQLVEALGLERVDFVGASWGGTVGCFFAERHGARLGRLVLLDVGYQEPLERASLAEWMAAARKREDDVPAELRGAILWAVAEEPPSAAQLARAGVPTLLLTASLPADAERADAVARFRAELPAAEVREIPQASHDLVGDAEAEVAAVVGPWLQARS